MYKAVLRKQVFLIVVNVIPRGRNRFAVLLETREDIEDIEYISSLRSEWRNRFALPPQPPSPSPQPPAPKHFSERGDSEIQEKRCKEGKIRKNVVFGADTKTSVFRSPRGLLILLATILPGAYLIGLQKVLVCCISDQPFYQVRSSRAWKVRSDAKAI
jgi:hypothetical protein